MIGSQVLHGRLAAVAAEMAERLRRTARSPGITEQHASATAVFAGDLTLATQHQTEPSHLFAMRASVRRLFDYFAFDLAEGDVLAVADPFHGGTEPQTLTLVVPHFHDGSIVLFPAVRAPLSDLAGEYPGAAHPAASEVWQESVRVTPVKLHRAGMPQRDVLRLLRRNSRTPTVHAADLDAMIGACREAGASLTAILRRHGVDAVTRMAADMQAYARRLVERRLATLPRQTGRGEAQLSLDGIGTLAVRVGVARGNRDLVLDFEGTDEAVAAAVNMTPEAASAFAVTPVLGGLLDSMPVNEGTLEPFRFRFPEGSLLRPPFPAATSLGSRVTGHAVAAAVTAALRSAGEDGCPDLHGLEPQAHLFSPVGSAAESKLIPLHAGFARSAQGWGPPALGGRRRLVSAEELEMRDDLRVLDREWRPDGGMRVRILNRRGPLEGNFLSAGGLGAPGGGIEIDGRPLTKNVGVALAENSVIGLDYPSFAGGSFAGGADG